MRNRGCRVFRAKLHLLPQSMVPISPMNNCNTSCEHVCRQGVRPSGERFRQRCLGFMAQGSGFPPSVYNLGSMIYICWRRVQLDITMLVFWGWALMLGAVHSIERTQSGTMISNHKMYKYQLYRIACFVHCFPFSLSAMKLFLVLC